MADETLPLSLGPSLVATKRCKRCRKTQPLSEFHYRPEQGRHRAECKDCYRTAMNARRDPIDNRRRAKAWLQANPDKARAHVKASYNRARSDITRWVGYSLRVTRSYCKRRNIEFSITAADMAALYDLQGGRCALTGRDLLYGSKGQQRDSLSIDRIEPKLGYILGNVRLITYQANFARNHFSDDELFAFCEAVLATRAGTAPA